MLLLQDPKPRRRATYGCCSRLWVGSVAASCRGNSRELQPWGGVEALYSVFLQGVCQHRHRQTFCGAFARRTGLMCTGPRRTQEALQPSLRAPSLHALPGHGEPCTSGDCVTQGLVYKQEQKALILAGGNMCPGAEG